MELSFNSGKIILHKNAQFSKRRLLVLGIVALATLPCSDWLGNGFIVFSKRFEFAKHVFQL